MQRGRGVRSGG